VDAFLSGRRIRCVGMGTCSDWHAIAAGTPQGAVLSPDLFELFIDDLPDCLPPESELALYADDAALWAKSLKTKRQLEILQQALDAVDTWSLDWHIPFSQPKSKAVTFSLRRSRLVTPSLRFAGGPLQNVERFDYLGVIHARSCTYAAQTDKALAKLRRSAFGIARVVGGSSAVHPLATRQLVNSIMVPQLAYGQPFWQINSAANRRKASSLLALPLKRCLHLPRTVDVRGVLCELDIPSPEGIRAQSLISAYNRLQAVPRGHTAFHAWRRATAVQNTLSPSHVFRQMRAFFSRQRIVVPESMQPVHIREEARQVDWKTWRSGPSKSLGQVKLEPGLSPYLLVDDTVTARARARLRFDRARLNASLHRRQLRDDPLCDLCLAPETPHHLLADCAHTGVLRAQTRANLRRHGIGFSSLIALGRPPPGLTPAAQRHCLRITGQFVAAATALRKC
jgi:hypothetical protein